MTQFSKRYSDKLLHYFFDNQHAGCLNTIAAAGQIYQTRVGYPENGDVLVLSVACVDDKIIEARFLACGGVTLIAGAEFICRCLEGQSMTQLQTITQDFLLQSLKLAPIYVHITSLLVLAVKQIYESFKSREFHAP